MAAPTQIVPAISSGSQSAVSKAKNPFARAVESFLDDARKAEDNKNPFYKEVMSGIGNVLLEDCSPERSAKCAQEFSAFVEGLERHQRRNSKTMLMLDKLKPLMSGLQQFTSVFDVLIQPAPVAVQAIYGGARIILQVSHNPHKVVILTEQ